MSFIHLHVYSSYSLLNSTATIEQLVVGAKERGFHSLALTDRNVMYGAVAFYKECLKHAIKPILGLTVDVISGLNGDGAYPLVLLAKNELGFKNLIKITSVVQTKSPEGIPVKWLKHYAEGIFALTPGAEGEIEQYIVNDETDKALEAARAYAGIFEKGHFFISLQKHSATERPESIEALVKLAGSAGSQLVATNRVHYLNKEDAFAHECLLAIKNGDKLQDEQREKLPSDQFYLKTGQEMAELFADYPDALENTIKIADNCNVLLEMNKQYLPKYPVEHGGSAEEMLERLCYQGLKERYRNPGDEHRERLAFELGIIQKMNFSDYFLIVWDFMKYARDAGILTGPGRGSAAGSLVAYVLYITDVDPIEHDLLFERFLNPERISMPDIDIDFPDHRRDEVIKYVAQKYGELHVAQIATFGTLAAKAAVRDTGRAFGLNTKELDRLSRSIPSKLGIRLAVAYKESGPLRQFVDESDFNRRLFETAKKIEGLPRHTSTHAAGVVISEQPLINLVPIQRGHDEVFLTQYSMEHLEDIGLLKMDFLGLRNLSLLESIISNIQRKTGAKIDIHSITFNDSKTFELLSRGDTTGIFQLESEGMRKVLTRLKPTHFEDIVAVNALYRPGPMENIPLYIDRKHGRRQIEYPHPDLEPILKNTYGVIVYQEQIMQIASKMAGFTLGEADLLRRAVSKKQKAVLDKERSHFVQGSLKQGYNEQTANELYDLIVRFANYGFNRSHAVAYSFIAYQLAYLKAHYPLFFMAALLTSAAGNESKLIQYIRELKQMDISILPPSINKSGYSFLVEKDSIRYSLAAIKGVGATALKEIFPARKQRRFEDIFDFCLRVSSKAVNRKTLEAFVHSGCFDEFGHDRAVLLASIDVALDHAQLVKPEGVAHGDLFADDDFFPKPKHVEMDPIGIEEKLSSEKDVLGLYLSDHPLSVFELQLKEASIPQLWDLTVPGKRVRTAAYITEVTKIRTKKGEAMAFVTLSDPGAELEAVAFPQVFSKYAVLLKQGNTVLLDGKLEERDGKKQLIIQAVDDLKDWAEQSAKNKPVLYLKISRDQENPEQLNRLKEILKSFKGGIHVVLHYESTEKTVRLADNMKVDGSKNCLAGLVTFLGKSNVILKE
ncbi:DNA polymerase III subunit alpha [Bacillus canaveralius]|uniref:DNA polymerase III subunit alpha n=1 Tax=Bacillus canaveralius TaxID=1403243 RepID=A0A2N5GFK6_9BACI|nr:MULTISPECIES: DNA polymerase III subunit alpha [Bacillus]PLR79511.1 DNA polymerase III subunit alpha [Bacillus canaveralius]PLR82337.1 DNA polymerase III subunit alpha [Bacillus sp. V33-4]PLR95165.1 DNA polymerase III subunit alpha [Bacillus canaveralius]RSK55855.1 DNA polymerase III subunit alpha [Bacillus canaveralius]